MACPDYKTDCELRHSVLGKMQEVTNKRERSSTHVFLSITDENTVYPAQLAPIDQLCKEAVRIYLTICTQTECAY